MSEENNRYKIYIYFSDRCKVYCCYDFIVTDGILALYRQKKDSQDANLLSANLLSANHLTANRLTALFRNYDYFTVQQFSKGETHD